MLVAAAASIVMTAAAAETAVAAPTAPQRPFCGITWGSLAKQAGPGTSSKTARVRDARAGQHACFDRLVFNLGKGKKPGYSVRYVRQITGIGSGLPIPVKGGAKLRILIRAFPAKGYPAAARNLVNVAGFRTFRQVRGAGSFEGITSVGLGVRSRLPFRVFLLNGPGTGSRLVIDVAHRWQA